MGILAASANIRPIPANQWGSIYMERKKARVREGERDRAINYTYLYMCSMNMFVSSTIFLATVHDHTSHSVPTFPPILPPPPIFLLL